MKIIVDADACPSLHLIEEVAQKYSVELLICTDVNHNINSKYGKVIIVDQGFQSVDMYISNLINKGDIVVTGDYGLALISLSKSAYAIHPKGIIYTNNNIDKMIFERHLFGQVRRQNKRIKGPKKRTKIDDDNLVNNLIKLLSKK